MSILLLLFSFSLNLDSNILFENAKLELAELLLVNSFSQKDINSFDYNVTFREMFTKSLDLFDKFAKNLEFVQYDGTKKIFKTHFDIEICPKLNLIIDYLIFWLQ